MSRVRGTAVRLPNGALFAIGPRPPKGLSVVRAGYSMLVLAANSYQPPATDFPGVCVVHAGIPDNRTVPLTAAQRTKIKRAAGIAARHLSAGYNALLTCELGLNRSGLTAVLTLVRLGWSKPQAVTLVRSMRWPALNNPLFIDVIAADRAG